MSGDRADYGQSLKIWLADAQKGSAEAQYYTATLYEKGAAGQPDFTQAAEWYRKAAEKGDKRAAVNLGRLYELGLGVPKDPREAFRWLAKASGLNDDTLALLANYQVSSAQVAGRIRDLEQALAGKELEIQKLRGELRAVHQEAAALRASVAEGTSQIQRASEQLKERERQAQALQAELAALRAQPDKRSQIAALEQRIGQLQAEIDREAARLLERNGEIAQLRARIAGLEKNADRIQVLEQTLAQRNSETQTLRAQLVAVNLDLQRLHEELQERRRHAAEERRKSQEAEQRYQRAHAQLELERAKPDHAAALGAYENTVKTLQDEMQKAKHALDNRNREVAQLQQRITALEAEAEQQAKALQMAAVTDLGFDGPTLDIIDPPLARSRGIQVTHDELAVPVSTGIRRSVTGRVLAPAGLRTLTVNGEAANPNDEGVFTAVLPRLRSGADEIAVQILAVDMQNKRAALKFMLKARGAVKDTPLAPKHELAGFGRYYALVIGNDHYVHWPPLANAIADATAVAGVLREHYGFQVTLLTDATRAQIMKALNHYRKMLTEKDNLLIYYAGHGHLEKDIDRGYWIPVDAEIGDNSEWVLLPSVTDILQLMSAKHVMVVADSCFGGKLTRSALAQLKPGLTDEARLDLLKILAQKRVRTAMTSGGVRPVLDAGGSGHSVFAEAFLGVLEDNTSFLEAERLFWAIRSRVVSASQKLRAEQIPTYDPIHMAGHESLGDFIFVPQGL